MTYIKTEWVNGAAPAINEDNLNKMEIGIFDAHELYRPVYIHDFGEIGTSDDAATFNAAIDYANSVTSTGSSGMTDEGVVIMLKPGVYNLPNGTSSAIMKDNIYFVGESPDSVIINVNSGTVFAFGNAGDSSPPPNGGGVANIKFKSTASPNVNQLCIDVRYAVRLNFYGIRLRNISQFVRLGTTATKYAIGIAFRDIRGWVFNSGKPTFNLVAGAGFYLSDSWFFVQGIPIPTAGSHAALDGTHFIQAGVTSGWDTIVINSVTCNRYFRSWYVSVDTSSAVINAKVSQFYGDYSAYGALFTIPASGGGGSAIREFSFYQCWFVAVLGNSFSAVVAGTLGKISGLRLNEVQANLSGGSGIFMSGPPTAVDDVSIVDCSAMGNAINGAGDAVYMDGVADFSINGGHLGRSSAGLAPISSQALNGITITANCRRYHVSGVHAGGSTSSYNITDPSATAAACFVGSNHCFDGTDPEYAGISSVTIPASGIDLVNNSPYKKTIYASGGTVGTYRINSTVVQFGGGNSTINLDAGEKWSSVYTAAPSVFMQIHK